MIDSGRVSLPSISIMKSVMVAARLMGISLFRMSISVIMGRIAEEIPTTTRILKMLEPITLPREISFVPLRLAERLTAASGKLVPIETTVRPMIKDGTFSFPAMEDAPSTKKSAPLMSKTKPPMSRIYGRMF